MRFGFLTTAVGIAGTIAPLTSSFTDWGKSN